jgi:thioesterase domain-containing protein
MGKFVSGCITVHVIPGDHRDMFLPPAVEITARHVNEALRDALRDSVRGAGASQR